MGNWSKIASPTGPQKGITFHGLSSIPLSCVTDDDVTTLPLRLPAMVDPILDLVGPVVSASASRAEHPGFESRVRRDYSWVESYH